MDGREVDDFLEVREELQSMTHSGLVDEVIIRMQSQQRMLIENWHSTKDLRKQNSDYRKMVFDCGEALDKSSDVIDVMAKKIKYWKNSFWFLAFLVMLTLLATFIFK
ncbi:hypothetical protein F993_01510 [Acinetobacter proteolyticus]|uniref:Uncharacterized protein n=1 Tax=Acinetobacter proteolyticus TaxID=1776741 RepID=A0ABN0JGD1_9GAMM|nr:hypothetical protein [Acinetobacter proteolyticus]ENU24194.1 hypothetical protein F993_01510 [Acinetobacter proteolyticus]